VPPRAQQRGRVRRAITKLGKDMQGLARYLNCFDGVADSMRDVLLLVGRIFIATVFLMTVSGGGPADFYLKSLNYPAPQFMAMLAHLAEWIIVVTLILGLATRPGALLAVVFLVIAVLTAHLYWQYPAAQQPLQWVFLSKDIAITGGVLVLFVTGGGRYSLDAKLMGK
jgi:putative oxidoreductase